MSNRGAGRTAPATPGLLKTPQHQIGGFCFVVQFHQEGGTTNGATKSSY